MALMATAFHGKAKNTIPSARSTGMADYTGGAAVGGLVGGTQPEREIQGEGFRGGERREGGMAGEERNRKKERVSCMSLCMCPCLRE